MRATLAATGACAVLAVAALTSSGAAATAPPAWWLRALDADGLVAPGPGKPVTIVDTGLDFAHPEFSGRPGTIPLDRQQITSPDDFHGTAISSLVGARGVRVRGLYPRALLNEWDASERDGLTLASIVDGIDAASRAGPGVINLSFGSAADVPALQEAILRALRAGSVVVAAAGDSRGFDFSPYPGEYPHVVTVGATDRRGRAAPFSSPSSAIDVAAPGVGVEVAVPASRDPSGYSSASGTSYSAALVSAALAWIWTRRPELDATQLVALVRRTARRPGGAFSNATGWGVLDLRAALRAPAPPPDPSEPNDDVALVEPGRTFERGAPLLTAPGRRRATVRARVDQNEDPADVYRALVPPHGVLRVTADAQAGDVALRVWGPDTPTILERGGRERRDLLAGGTRGRHQTAEARNGGAAAEVVYVDVSAGVSRTASYTLRLETS
ncbi:MAG TPA: S8 family serine peptidase [Gaiellaceae bacterium]|nr:S8 family serine peptidase [Gaiellaceae bacterium]